MSTKKAGCQRHSIYREGGNKQRYEATRDMENIPNLQTQRQGYERKLLLKQSLNIKNRRLRLDIPLLQYALNAVSIPVNKHQQWQFLLIV